MFDLIMFAPQLMMVGSAALPTGSSGDNLLASLKLSVGALSPSFASGTTSYVAGVGAEVDKIYLVIGPNTPVGTEVYVNGQRAFTGVSPVQSGYINLTAPQGPASTTTTITVGVNGGGATKTYTIVVTRDAPAGQIAPDPLNWAFQLSGLHPEVNVFSITVKNPNASSMTITAGAFSRAQGDQSFNPPGWIWATSFPLTIPGLSSVAVTANYNGAGQAELDTTSGQWTCGSSTGSMQMTARRF